ncbi:DUF1768-domain-containing protein [Russula aff. rugulosa BPL654]|nr:DUF1768-domain-containing protein [Russula aff. rugulosa BPL654]
MATLIQNIFLVFPSLSNAETAHRPTTRISEDPIYFYDSDKPYFEFTNFSNHPIEYHGVIYPTAEHLFQAFKFMETDPVLAERIRTLPTARMAQQEARKQAHRQRSNWLEVNVAVMDKVLRMKFSQHHSLRHLLRDTGSRELIEDSPTDWFWGIGDDGRGRNELGKALMRLRGQLPARQRH